MQTVRKLRKRTGFTLVELLIVIIIIGILAGAMLLVAGSGTDKAEATKIISDLRSLKAAALMYYADGNKTLPTGVEDLQTYMDRKMDNAGNYDIVVGTGTGEGDHWFVERSGLVAGGISDALAKSAEENGLWDEATMSGDAYQAGSTSVFMRAR